MSGAAPHLVFPEIICGVPVSYDVVINTTSSSAEYGNAAQNTGGGGTDRGTTHLFPPHVCVCVCASPCSTPYLLCVLHKTHCRRMSYGMQPVLYPTLIIDHASVIIRMEFNK